MSKKFRHIRHQARRHQKDHLHLKNLLSKDIRKEAVLGIFFSTLIIVITSIVIFFNWGGILSFFSNLTQPDQAEVTPPTPSSDIEGFKLGFLATDQINGQSMDQYVRFMSQILSQGYKRGLEATTFIGKREQEADEVRQLTYLDSILLSTDLGKGYHLTSARTEGGRMLQKSILATYYLGEKTVDITSSIQTDSKLLSQISSTTGVDIFAYLNQSSDRANTLDSYLNLLKILRTRAEKRSTELESQLNFLNANFKAQEQSITLTQEQFFEHLKIFDGQDADQKLAEFVGLEQDQTEIRAQMGAYKGIKNYYDFFLPQLDNLILAIEKNRDPLIAGVKVVEIQNMTLPLIIREK